MKDEIEDESPGVFSTDNIIVECIERLLPPRCFIPDVNGDKIEINGKFFTKNKEVSIEEWGKWFFNRHNLESESE